MSNELPSPLAEYSTCRLCPRDCKANRAAGQRGRCGQTAVLRTASSGPHFGEEPPFSGQQGSGTIFFSGCPARCFFCQNHQITHDGLGADTSGAEFFQAARALLDRGVHNLNFVTPEHFWPHIRQLCSRLRAAGCAVPFLWNTSGYLRPDLVPSYAEWIDIFLPDFKFSQPALAQRCMQDARYPELALAGLRAMIELKGFLHPFDPTGATPARTGVLVRHLVLPGEVENSLEVLRLLRREFGRLLPLSIMCQFRPVARCFEQNDLARTVTGAEYQRVVAEANELEFENAFIQEFDAQAVFLPDFTRNQPFAGNSQRAD